MKTHSLNNYSKKQFIYKILNKCKIMFKEIKRRLKENKKVKIKNKKTNYTKAIKLSTKSIIKLIIKISQKNNFQNQNKYL